MPSLVEEQSGVRIPPGELGYPVRSRVGGDSRANPTTHKRSSGVNFLSGGDNTGEAGRGCEQRRGMREVEEEQE
eukprot:scaffold18711_cov119-Isochrysis_galbana.AAC.5